MLTHDVLENLMMFIKVCYSLQFKQQNEATNKMNCTLQVAAQEKWGIIFTNNLTSGSTQYSSCYFSSFFMTRRC